MIIKLTPKLVVDLWHNMLKEFDMKMRPKSKSLLCKIIRPFTGISKENWEHVSITIGRTIYTNVNVGVEKQRSTLLGQCCLIAHECQHRLQNDDDWLYPIKYLLSKKYRAKCEADAYTCNLEIAWYITGRMPTVSMITETLRMYKLSQGALRLAKKTITRRREIIEQGPIITSSGRFTIRFLKTNRS